MSSLLIGDELSNTDSFWSDITRNWRNKYFNILHGMTGRDDHPRMTEQGSDKKRWKMFKNSFIMEFQEANPVDTPRNNEFPAIRTIIMAIIILAFVLLIMVFIVGGEFCIKKTS